MSLSRSLSFFATLWRTLHRNPPRHPGVPWTPLLAAALLAPLLLIGGNTESDPGPFRRTDTDVPLAVTVRTDRVSAEAGETVTALVTVVNAGKTWLPSVATTATAPACVRAELGSLAAGQRTTYSCTVDVAVSSTRRNGLFSVTATAGEQGSSEPAEVFLLGRRPELHVLAALPRGPVAAGTTVDLQLTVVNVGDTRVNSVTLSIPALPECGRPAAGALAPGATVTVDCELTAPTLDVVGVAVATGYADGVAVRTLSAPVTVDIAQPRLRLVPAGDRQLSVVNLGDVAITELKVAAGTCDRTGLTMLMPGTATELSCTGTVQLRGRTVLGEISAELAMPAAAPSALRVTRQSAHRSFRAGEPVHDVLTVENVGASPVTDLTIETIDCGTAALAPLAPGQRQEYDCTFAAPTDDRHVIAIVRGTGAAGAVSHSVSTSARLDILHPELSASIDPEYSGSAALTWVMTVENTGDFDLANLVITTSVPGCGPVQLAAFSIAGPPARFSCSQQLTQRTTAVVSAQAVLGPSNVVDGVYDAVSVTVWATAARP